MNEYTKQNVLDESILRKSDSENCYNLSIFHIQENIGLDVWIFVDENTDVISYCIANLSAGKLCNTEKT